MPQSTISDSQIHSVCHLQQSLSLRMVHLGMYADHASLMNRIGDGRTHTFDPVIVPPEHPIAHSTMLQQKRDAPIELVTTGPQLIAYVV